MLASTPFIHLARITLEAVGPLSLSTGGDSTLFEMRVVTDANGLPAIPGTALAGALRHAIRQRHGAAAETALFGASEIRNGSPSPLTLTWAHIHDSRDCPIDGLDLERHWATDPLLSAFAASELPHRDHVRLGHRGVSVAQGKFERSFVPAGHRFTFEMAWWEDGKSQARSHWEALKAILAGPEFRLGGATRRGYGHLRVQRRAEACFDLRNPADFQAYAEHPRRLDHPTPALRELPPLPIDNGQWLSLELNLSGEDFWRFGGGGVPLAEGGRPSESLPYTEERVMWIGSRGHLTRRRVVVPASAVKGALAHRTAYHYNRLTGQFAEHRTTARHAADANPAVRYLFGHADTGRAPSRSGGVLIDDAVVDHPTAVRLAHNSLDRYTGGVRDGVFYTEEAIHGNGFPLRIRVAANLWREAPDPIRLAFRAAIADLAEGRLPLGAASAKGLGYFEGDILRDELGEMAA